MPVRDIYIAGVGVFLPETVSIAEAVDQGRFTAEHASETGLLGAAVAGDMPAPDMALAAAREALSRAGRSGEEADLLLYAGSWHQGPDGWLPGAYLQSHLGGDAPTIEVRQGCNGMFGALELAIAYLRADQNRRTALLVASDNFGTPLMDRWTSGSGFVLADVATSLVLTTEPGFARVLSAGTVTIPGAERAHRGDEPMFPPGSTVGRSVDFDARLAAFRDHALTQPGGFSPLFEVQKKTSEIVDRCLTEAGIDVTQISRVACNNMSREMVEQRMMAPLGLPLSLSTWDYGRGIGHCGPSDQVASMNHLLETGGLTAGDHLLMFGMGPGITLSSAVIEILDTPPWAGAPSRTEEERPGNGL